MPKEQSEADAELAELETKGRWSDLARALEQRAAGSTGPQRVALLLRAMALYRDRFANHHRGMLAAEGVIEEQDDNEQAVSYLLEIYQKRRMHDELATLEERLARKGQGRMDGAEGD